MKKIIGFLIFSIFLISIIPTNIAFAHSVKTIARIIPDNDIDLKNCLYQDNDVNGYEKTNNYKTIAYLKDYTYKRNLRCRINQLILYIFNSLKDLNIDLLNDK